MHILSPNPIYDAGLERAGQNVLGRLPMQGGTSKECLRFGLLTQQNPTRLSSCFTKIQTQHTNIRPRKPLSHTLSLPLHPPTSAWHTSKAPPDRLENRGLCEHGGLLGAFCLHSVKGPVLSGLKSLTGHCQSPFHSTAESGRMLRKTVHLIFSVAAILTT